MMWDRDKEGVQAQLWGGGAHLLYFCDVLTTTSLRLWTVCCMGYSKILVSLNKLITQLTVIELAFRPTGYAANKLTYIGLG